jgi:hypothetical protein
VRRAVILNLSLILYQQQSTLSQFLYYQTH